MVQTKEMIDADTVRTFINNFRVLLDRLDAEKMSYEECIAKVDVMEKLLNFKIKKIKNVIEPKPWQKQPYRIEPYIHERSKDDLTPQWANEYQGDL